MTAPKGRFAWHELMTTDVDAAKAFYSEVIGWKTRKWEGGPDYTMFVAGDKPIAGVMQLPEQAVKDGAPPHWLGHVGVPDVAATRDQADKLGGTILHTQKIPEVGEFAVIRDPQGAVISAFQPTDPSYDPGRGPGQVSWNELNTTDWEAARDFYTGLFGWNEVDSMDMGPELGTYWMYGLDGGDGALGGMSSVASSQKLPPHWLFYVSIDDLDAALERVEKNGGQVLNGPMEVPGGDRIAQCMDPQGAAFALHSTAK
jgi:predicted enzyme related to lactoylglutathione lyase